MSFIGVVLAGGQSKRMGRDKALLMLDGESMLSRTLSCLQKSGATHVIVSRNGPGNEGFCDIHPHKGPLSGIHAATVNKPEQDLLLVPVDLPYLHFEALQRLSQYAKQHHRSCHFTGHNLPLYLRYNSANIGLLEQILLRSDDYSVAGFIRQIGAQALRPLDSLHLLNSNSPEQWQMAKQALLAPSTPRHKETLYGTFHSLF